MAATPCDFHSYKTVSDVVALKTSSLVIVEIDWYKVIETQHIAGERSVEGTQMKHVLMLGRASNGGQFLLSEFGS